MPIWAFLGMRVFTVRARLLGFKRDGRTDAGLISRRISFVFHPKPGSSLPVGIELQLLEVDHDLVPALNSDKVPWNLARYAHFASINR